jgi:TorA maturation chaperone TorD
MKEVPKATAGPSAQNRSNIYSLLANAFAYPTQAQSSRAQELASAVLELADASPEIGALAGAWTRVDGSLERDYIATFTLSTSSDCPLFETAFTTADSFAQSETMADIAGFYRAFGVVPSTGTRPDELTAELEFMSFLCAKEAYAAERLGPPRVRQARKAQRLFLRDHLMLWAPELGLRVAASTAPSSPYWLAGRALAAWLAEERSRIGVERQSSQRQPAVTTGSKGGTS